MAVQVHLTFNSVDEAIVALGKMVLSPKIKNVANASVEAGTGSKVGSGGAGTAGAGKQADSTSTANGPAGASTSTPPAPAPAARRARSDAGKPRGPYKTTGEPAASEPGVVGQASAAPQQPAAPATPTTTAAPVAPVAPAKEVSAEPAPSTAATKVPSLEDVQSAVERLFNGKDFETCAGVLSRFGVRRGKDLAEDQRFDFIAKADRVLAGEAI